MKIFLTGTDTGVGKTYVACALIRQLRQEGRDAVGLKPICCGDRGDAQALMNASDGELEIDTVNPSFFPTPVSPYMAAILESRPVDLNLVHSTCRRVLGERENVVVEGVGGWRVPISADYEVSNLAADLGLPVIIVVANRVGALNHTQLTVDAVVASGVTCAGIIINDSVTTHGDSPIARAGNRMLLESLLEVPILGELGFGERVVRWHSASLLGSATPVGSN